MIKYIFILLIFFSISGKIFSNELNHRDRELLNIAKEIVQNFYSNMLTKSLEINNDQKIKFNILNNFYSAKLMKNNAKKIISDKDILVQKIYKDLKRIS